MSLFQKSVEKKYLNELDSNQIAIKYSEFQSFFGDIERQENIRNSKEEQFQEGFLRALFVEILGYTLNPEPNFDLTTELKNIGNSKKTDGAIVKDGLAIAVIELKQTSITDLDSIESQAFGYKNHHSKCTYVITSNFEKLRFYIQNAIEYLEFNLFDLSTEQFSLMWICLSKDSVFKDIPLKIKEYSIVQEESITKKLYTDYTRFREAIFNNIIINNTAQDKLTLFKKTQKLLDRFLFIFFAEDRGLLPPNSVSRIIERWNNLKNEDAYKPLYDIFRQYFDYMNKGRKGKASLDDIHAYNGGLFLEDVILDTIKIDDDLLREHALRLSTYDYSSEVDVNILGHIFEHSIGDIETIQNQIIGEEIDTQKSKRKKDGIFYTPKYITKYIVENSLGQLCSDKHKELGINTEEFSLEHRKSKKKELSDKLDVYRNWLLKLTILDPACGSGAFLNQSLEFLIEEHHKVDELKSLLAKHEKDVYSIIHQDYEIDILENNIYGVDLNEESVEIAKLSLWLRTAQKGRKLNTLNNNIKCGNSLIYDAHVAGDKSFIWQSEFPEIFAKGGFDVIIGNPPYVRVQGLKQNYFEHTKFYEQNYKAASGNYDIYALFIEKSLKLINQLGRISFILPHKFLITDFGKGIREILLNTKSVSEIVHFGSDLVFEEATTYTCILTLDKKEKEFLKFKQIKPYQIFDEIEYNYIKYKDLTNGQWILTDNKVGEVLKKIYKQSARLNDIFDRFVQGIITGKDAVFCVKGKNSGIYLSIEGVDGSKSLIEKSILKPHLRGEDISKYKKLKNYEWLIFPYKLILGKAVLYTPEEMKSQFPKTFEYLKQFESTLRARENSCFDNSTWYQYSRNQAISVLEQPKIITPEVCFGSNMALDLNNFYHNSKCHSLLLNDTSSYKLKSVLPILNSKVFWFYLSNTGNKLRGDYIGVKRKVLELFPLPESVTSESELLLIKKADAMIQLTGDLQDISNQLIDLLISRFNIEKFSQKLQKWFELEFKDFIHELNKVKINLNLKQEAEWLKFFNEQKQIALKISSQIETTDIEINQKVYELYNLTKNEIETIEKLFDT